MDNVVAIGPVQCGTGRPLVWIAGPCVIEAHDLTLDHVNNFLECVKSRKLPNGDVLIGHRSAQASHLGNISYMERRRIDFDPVRVIPDESKSLADGAIAPWAKGDKKLVKETLQSLARSHGIGHLICVPEQTGAGRDFGHSADDAAARASFERDFDGFEL